MPDFSYNKPRCFSLPCLSTGDGFATSLEGRILHIFVFCMKVLIAAVATRIFCNLSISEASLSRLTYSLISRNKILQIATLHLNCFGLSSVILMALFLFFLLQTSCMDKQIQLTFQIASSLEICPPKFPIRPILRLFRQAAVILRILAALGLSSYLPCLLHHQR